MTFADVHNGIEGICLLWSSMSYETVRTLSVFVRYVTFRQRVVWRIGIAFRPDLGDWG